MQRWTRYLAAVATSHEHMKVGESVEGGTWLIFKVFVFATHRQDSSGEGVDVKKLDLSKGKN